MLLAVVLIVADCVKDKLGIVQGKRVREKEGEYRGRRIAMDWAGVPSLAQ